MKKIKLTHGEYALVDSDDSDDFDFLSQYTWSLCINVKNRTNRYAATNIAGKTIHMHHLLLKKKSGFVRDHIDKNGLNNQRKNLRYLTISQNNFNQKRRTNTRTGITGVYFEDNSYVVKISFKGKNIHIGRSKSLMVAKKLRKDAEKKYYPNIKIGKETDIVHYPKPPKIPLHERQPNKNRTYKYKGVYPHALKWRAAISNGKKGMKYLGLYSTQEEAAKVYIQAFKEKHGVAPYSI